MSHRRIEPSQPALSSVRPSRVKAQRAYYIGVTGKGAHNRVCIGLPHLQGIVEP